MDQSLQYIDETEKPFFLSLGFGAVHGPFNVAKEYIDKYKGKFDEGWDAERGKIFERQKALGIFQAETSLSVRNSDVKAWDDLNETEKAVAARHMEVYAGFLEHTDAQIGRLIKELEKRGEYENTIFTFLSDNGASSNGGADGVPMAHAKVNFTFFNSEEQVDLLNQFGNAEYGTQYNTGWANVSNTPFRSYKSKAYNGGVKTACIVSGKGIKEPGRISDNLITAVDITPTMLDLLQIEQINEKNGIKLKEMQGISFKKTLEHPEETENARDELYMMLFMDHLYADASGYILLSNDKDPAKLELYDMKNDPAQVTDLAEQMPEKVTELAEKFEAARAENMNAQNFIMDVSYGVKPEILLERYGELAQDALNVIKNKQAPEQDETKIYMGIYKALTYQDPKFGYRGMGTAWYRSPESPNSKQDYVYDPSKGYFYGLASAPTMNTTHTVTIDLESCENPEGVLLANGGIDGGYVVYVQDKKLVYEYKYNDRNQVIKAEEEFTEDVKQIELKYDKKSINEGDLTILVDGKEVAYQTINTLPVFPSYDYISFGEDVGSKVSKAYTGDYAFNGKILEVRMHLENDKFQ